MKSASVLSALAAGTIAAISTSVCAGSNGTDAVMRSLDQVNRIYTPEKTTHTELLLRLNDLGCHYRVNNRMKADPEDVMKHTFGWFYRLLPDERGIAILPKAMQREYMLRIFSEMDNGGDSK